MKKIPTVFRRDPANLKTVLPEVTPGCEWVLAGEGVATRKYDGTCVMLDAFGDWWSRREVKPGKTAPEGFQSVVTDPATGKTVGWVPIADSSFERFHAEALEALESPTRVRTYELCGPKINGNPERLGEHRLIEHATAEEVLVNPDELNFAALRALVGLSLAVDGLEGVVWHHPDGRMAKLKARDFQHDRSVARHA